MLFHSYVGAVYATQGMTAVQAWIGPLVDPEFDGSTPMDADSDPLYNNVNNAKKFKTEFSTPPEPVSMPPPPPPPPMSSPPPLPNPLAPAQQSTAFLPLFNQTANQRRVFVEYPAQFSGPPHAGRWTVKCVGEFERSVYNSMRRLIVICSQRYRERCGSRCQQAARQGRGGQTSILLHGMGSS